MLELYLKIDVQLIEIVSKLYFYYGSRNISAVLLRFMLMKNSQRGCSGAVL